VIRSPAPSREFTLLARCCSWNFATSGDAAPDTSGPLDWQRLIRLSRYHRVQGLAWNAISKAEVPSEVADELAADARSIAATNLAIVRECGELSEAFARVGMPLLFLKGLSLGALAYRNPLLKMGWYVDLLIDPGDLPAAADLLTSRGFAVREPPPATELMTWHRRSKESLWTRADGLHIELHTRLADNPDLIPSLDVHSSTQRVAVTPDIHLATFRRDELFAYLCVHGASSAWFRLKWASDLAALIHGRPEGEIDRLYRRSQELGAHRAAAQALLVTDTLFGSLAGTGLRQTLAGNWPNRLLATAALHQLAGRPDEREPTEAPFGTLRIHWTQLLLKPGLGFALSEAGRQISDVLHRQAAWA